MAERKWMGAVQGLLATVKLDPQMAEAWNDLSYAALREEVSMGSHAVPPEAGLSSFQSAIQAAERALELRPDWAYAQYNLGLALLAQGEYSKAVEPLRRSGEQQPDRHEPLAALGLAYVGTGEMARAGEVCRQARQIDPYSLTATECLELAGEAMKRLPDSEAAIGGRRYEPGKGFVGGKGEGQFYRVSPPYTCGIESPDGFRQSFIGCNGDGWTYAWSVDKPEAGTTPAGLGVGSTRADLLRLYGESYRSRQGYHYALAEIQMTVHVNQDDRIDHIRFERLTPSFAVDNLIHDELYPQPLQGWEMTLLAGGLKLGMTKAQVEERLGEGKPTAPGERFYLYREGKVRVLYSDQDGALVFDLYREGETARGVAVGDPVERVRSAYGKPDTESGGALSYRSPSQERSDRLVFHTQESRVVQITLVDLSGK